MDSYQPIYDAVRSRISNGDIGAAVSDALRGTDIGFHVSQLCQAVITPEVYIVSETMRRPSVLYRPAISLDGNRWCALYGANIQDGVAGFGDSPAEAMAAFDAAWSAKVGS